MAGAYCKFCGTRCFVLRVIPDGPCKGWTGHLATCQRGMMHDFGKTGHTHITAVNPVTEHEAVAALVAAMPAIEKAVLREMARRVLALDAADRTLRHQPDHPNKGPWNDMRTTLRRLARGEPIPDPAPKGEPQS